MLNLPEEQHAAEAIARILRFGVKPVEGEEGGDMGGDMGTETPPEETPIEEPAAEEPTEET